MYIRLKNKNFSKKVNDFLEKNKIKYFFVLDGENIKYAILYIPNDFQEENFKEIEDLIEITEIKSAYKFDSLDAFNEYADNYAKQYLLQKMIVTMIAADNNITVTADDINSTGEELASYYGYDDYNDILDTYGKTMNSEIGYQVLYQKIVDFVCENVTVNDTTDTAE